MTMKITTLPQNQLNVKTTFKISLDVKLRNTILVLLWLLQQILSLSTVVPFHAKGLVKSKQNLHLRLGVDLAQSEALNKCTSGSKTKNSKKQQSY